MPYRTVRAEASGSLVIEKSEFIAKIAPVTSSEDAAAFISTVRSEHRKARHSCYAYTLRKGFETRFSDDGEPQGTAGQPILDVIKKNSLTDVCIVVTRYFGGILLGKGGLTRAYSGAASLSVSQAEIMLMRDARECILNFDYSFYDRLLRILPNYEAKISEQDFSDAVYMKLLIPEEHVGTFSDVIRELSNAKIEPDFSDIICADFS